MILIATKLILIANRPKEPPVQNSKKKNGKTETTELLMFLNF
jgi:hypothetical protein